MTQTQILLLVSNLLDKYGIKHCLMFGTLLGAVRNNDFMEWDPEDTDLGIFEQFWKDDLVWDNFNFDLKKLGLCVRDMAYNYICIEVIGKPLHVDLYLLLKTPKEYQVIVTGIVAHFPLEDFLTLDELEFKGKVFKVPHNVKEHLEHNYGPDWQIANKNPTKEYSRTPVNNYNKITYTYIISEYK
jgi:hypothetical protein